MTNKIRVSIVGSTGYTGGELLRLLLRHPFIQIAHLTSENYAGQPIHQIHRFLKGRLGTLCEKLNVPAIAADSDVVFLGLPHGEAAKTAAGLIAKGARVIDLSADFRLKDAKTFKQWYGEHPVPSLIKEAVYGLPERYRDSIRSAKLIANPGCYATTSILAGLPLFAQHLLGTGPVIVDACSGISGAGRKKEDPYLFAEANESVSAYALKGHRHQPEILQEWWNAFKDAQVSGSKVKTSKPSNLKTFEHSLIFVPHLSPMTRGIFATLYAPLARRTNAEALRDVYGEYYAKEPFVTVLKPFESPETKAVSQTNHCQIGVAVDESGRQAIVMAVLDNLGKGASGQAIQNLNLMFGFEETTGLL